MRKVKIFIKIDGVIMAALEKVILLMTNLCEIVSDATQADLIISDSLTKIGQYFNPEKYFIVIPEEKMDEKKVPDNVRILHYLNLIGFYEVIVEVIQNIQNKTEEEIIEKITPHTNAKRILVIEDNPLHRKSANKFLVGHNLSIASGYDEAMAFFAIAESRIDIVMSDLYLPMSSKTLSEKAFEIGKEIPYGLLLALEATRRGAKYVAIVTDLGHHDDAFSAAFDHFSQYTYEIFGAKVKLMHAPMKHIDDQYVKDWGEALKILIT